MPRISHATRVPTTVSLACSCAPGRILPTGITDAGYKLITDHRLLENFAEAKISRAWAEVWAAALLLAPTWALASVAAWPLPMLLQWGWLLVWRSPSE
jgi:hypothetical protein